MTGVKQQNQWRVLAVLFVLGVIAILLTLFTKYVLIGNRSAKVIVVRQQLGTVISAIHVWETQTSVHSERLRVTMETLFKQGFLSSATLHNPWGYRITLTNVSDHGVDIQTTLPGIYECRRLRRRYPNARQCTSGQFALHIPLKF